jgi:hypothetical protein
VFVNLSTPAWTMLTGTWDEINQRLSLYVNAGLPQIAGRAVDPGTPSAIGRFTLGAVNNNGTNGSYWKGLIDDVWAMPGVVNINQVATLGQQPRLPELTSW